MGRVIAIAGFAPDSKEGINQEPASTEVWGMNNAYRHVKHRASKWFQIHPRDWNVDHGRPAGEYGREKGHVKWLTKYDGELFLAAPDERVPNAKVYPLAEIVSHFGMEPPYLTSTIAYMVAYAVYEHDHGNTVSEIRIHGINLTTAEEYFNQRPCLEFLCGYAKGKGIKVWVPETCALFRGALYAQDSRSGDIAKMTQKRLEHWRTQHITAREKIVSGAYVVEELKAWIATFRAYPEMDVPAAIASRVKQVQQIVRSAGIEADMSAASYREAQHTLGSFGEVAIPATEFPPMTLADAPIGYTRDELQEVKDAGEGPVAPGRDAKPEPALSGEN